jgi:hypothetical protein
MSTHQNHDPTRTAEASIPTENVANNRRMSGTMRRKAAKRTMPPMPALLPPSRDEDLPAAKRPRIQTYISTVVDGGVDADAQSITDSDTAPSNDNSVAVARTDVDTEAATMPSGKSTRAPRRCWKPEDDARLTEAVKKHGPDWNAIAALVPGRMLEQCRERWVYVLDSTRERKKGKSWTAEEDADLIAAVKKHGGTDWRAVVADMSGQTNVQCRQRWVYVLDPTSDRATGKWTAKEDAVLTRAVEKHGHDWNAVAALIPGRITEGCRQRWIYILDPTRDRTWGETWTAQEDAKLTEEVRKHGSDWVAVAADVTGRTNRHCRERWVYALDPTRDHKTGLNWTVEEDAELKDAVKKHGNKWVAVAAGISGRSNRQCRQRWTNVKDPTHKRKPGQKWTAEEDAELIAVVKKRGNTDWVAVAAGMSGQTNVQCRKRWMNNLGNTDRTTGKWTAQEDAKLTEAVDKHGQDWRAVAALVPGRMYEQCRQRYIYILDPIRDRKWGRTWTAQEDAKIFEAVRTHGNNWVAVAAGVAGRTNRQCRERWVYVLDPTRDHKNKGKSWKAKEDAELMDAVKRHGNNWVAVAKDMPGRSNRQCCQRWSNEFGPQSSDKDNGSK